MNFCPQVWRKIRPAPEVGKPIGSKGFFRLDFQNVCWHSQRARLQNAETRNASMIDRELLDHQKRFLFPTRKGRLDPAVSVPKSRKLPAKGV
jgi:hypothetical protein